MSSRTIATNDNLLQVFNKYDIQALCYGLGNQLLVTASIPQKAAIALATKIANIGPLSNGCYLLQLDIMSTMAVSPTNNYYRNTNYRVYVSGGNISTITSFGGFTSANAGYTPPAVGADIGVYGIGTNTLNIDLNNISTLNTSFVLRATPLSVDQVTLFYKG